MLVRFWCPVPDLLMFAGEVKVAGKKENLTTRHPKCLSMLCALLVTGVCVCWECEEMERSQGKMGCHWHPVPSDGKLQLP